MEYHKGQAFSLLRNGSIIDNDTLSINLTFDPIPCNNAFIQVLKLGMQRSWFPVLRKEDIHILIYRGEIVPDKDSYYWDIYNTDANCVTLRNTFKDEIIFVSLTLTPSLPLRSEGRV